MKRTLLTSLVALTFTGLSAQSIETPPQLVVTLSIDQLRSDYMEAFSSLYGERGFKRLMKEGRYYPTVDFQFSTDRASAIATLYTGAYPSVHGIIAEEWMDPTTHHLTNCVDDPHFMGNFTNESTSPNKMLASNIGDELKIATRKRAMVYAISPFRDAAVLSAGHCADGALWINENTGKWCTSTFYKDAPWWLSQYNERASLDKAEEDTWSPTHPLSRYNFLPVWKKESFKHKFKDRDNRYRLYTTSPLINGEVNRLTEELLTKTDMGKDEVTDYLSLTYYAGNYDHQSAQSAPIEMQDTYVKVDHYIEQLLDMLDKKVGLRHILFVVTSTGYSDLDNPDFQLYNIPGGTFYIDRCAALLNMYLMATYGQGKYVETYYHDAIYLNHQLIEQKKLSLAEIQDKAADFLLQCSGVAQAYSGHRIEQGAWSPQMSLVRNGYNRTRSGDVLLKVLPGWSISQKEQKVKSTRISYTPAPLILLSPAIKAEKINAVVPATGIAPTISKSMRIRAPNGAGEAPLL